MILFRNYRGVLVDASSVLGCLGLQLAQLPVDLVLLITLFHSRLPFFLVSLPSPYLLSFFSYYFPLCTSYSPSLVAYCDPTESHMCFTNRKRKITLLIGLLLSLGHPSIYAKGNAYWAGARKFHFKVTDFNPVEILPGVTLLCSLVNILDLIILFYSSDVLVIFPHCIPDSDELCFAK